MGYWVLDEGPGGTTAAAAIAADEYLVILSAAFEWEFKNLGC